MSGIKLCVFFIASIVLTNSYPVPDVFIESKHDEILPVVSPNVDKDQLTDFKREEHDEPVISPNDKDQLLDTKHEEHDEILPAVSPNTAKDQVSGGIVFLNPPSLCVDAVENVDEKCVDHCKNKGYSMGLCFETKCNCV